MQADQADTRVERVLLDRIQVERNKLHSYPTCDVLLTARAHFKCIFA